VNGDLIRSFRNEAARGDQAVVDIGKLRDYCLGRGACSRAANLGSHHLGNRCGVLCDRTCFARLAMLTRPSATWTSMAHGPRVSSNSSGGIAEVRLADGWARSRTTSGTGIDHRSPISLQQRLVKTGGRWSNARTTTGCCWCEAVEGQKMLLMGSKRWWWVYTRLYSGVQNWNPRWNLF